MRAIKDGEADEVPIEDEWELWSTEQLETEKGEIEAEIVNIQGQLDRSEARTRDGYGNRNYEWEGRARAAMRYRKVELNRLTMFLGRRRKADRARAHEFHQKKNNADRTFQDNYVVAASKFLPPEWHEYLKATAHAEMDKAKDEWAKLVAQNEGRELPIGP